MRDPTVKESLSSLFVLPRAGVAGAAAAACAPAGRAHPPGAPAGRAPAERPSRGSTAPERGGWSCQAKAIAESFNSAFFHHGYPVGRREAADAGLNVVKAESLDLADTLWAVWKDVAAEMQVDAPFDPLIEVMKDEEPRERLTTVPTVDIPADVPLGVAQQVYQSVVSQLGVTERRGMDYELPLVTVESPRCRSEFRETGKINAVRLPGMNLQVTTIRAGVGREAPADADKD